MRITYNLMWHARLTKTETVAETILFRSTTVMMSSNSYGVSGYGTERDKVGVKALEEETAREMIDRLTKDEGNDECADCGDFSKPQSFLCKCVNDGLII